MAIGDKKVLGFRNEGNAWDINFDYTKGSVVQYTDNVLYKANGAVPSGTAWIASKTDNTATWVKVEFDKTLEDQQGSFTTDYELVVDRGVLGLKWL
jgi:hypothetical protein